MYCNILLRLHRSIEVSIGLDEASFIRFHIYPVSSGGGGIVLLPASIYLVFYRFVTRFLIGSLLSFESEADVLP